MFFNLNLLAEENLQWPLLAEPGISSSYCEFRSAHFHAGVDIKTWGARSLPCLAVADGYVSRIKVQSNGYGRALYLTYDSVKVAVYAHLDRFAPVVEEIVRNRQESTGEFEVDIILDKSNAPFFKRGEIVAYSGVTGTVHPHLHFETRTGYDITHNPLLKGLSIRDTIPPVPVAIAISPLDAVSTVEGDCQPRLYTRLLRRPDGRWEPGDPIGVTGRIGISIDSYDQTNNATNELAVYGMDLIVDGEVYFSTRFDWFSYDDIRKIELERDYRLYRRGKGVFDRLYRVQGNNLALCSGLGVIDAGTIDPFPINIQIKLYDIYLNSSEVCLKLVSDQIEDTTRAVGGTPLIRGNNYNHWNWYRIGVEHFDGYLRISAPPGAETFKVLGCDYKFKMLSIDEGVAAVWIPPLDVDGTILLKSFDKRGYEIGTRPLRITWVIPNKERQFYSEDSLFSVCFYPESVYEATIVSIEPQPNYEDTGFIELVYKVEPREQALKSKIELRFNAYNKYNEFGWGVFYYNTQRGWMYLPTRYENHTYIGEARSLELFALVRDTIPPMISCKPIDEITTDRRPLFSAIVKDDLSGIIYSGITITLDGRKIPAEYDQPRARVFYKPTRQLSMGSHNYTIKVEDRIGNVNFKTLKFEIK